MAQLPLLYRNVRPLDRERDRSVEIPDQRSFLFAAKTQLVPAVIDEFFAAARELPIVFVQDVNRPACVFVTGAQPNTNAFVTAEGRWNGSYVPAYLRRYPFILGEVAGSDSLVCTDDPAPEMGSGPGKRLFTESGEPTETLNSVVALVRNYAEAAKRTEAFIDRVMGLKLLRSVSLDMTAPDGSKSSIHGVAVVDEERLKQLDGSTLESLQKEGYLPLLYAQLFSMGALAGLTSRQPLPLH